VSASTTYESPRAKGPARWQQVVLVLSLSLNLLIAGAILGAVGFHWRGGERPGQMRPGPALALMGPVGKFAATLAPERRAELRDVMALHQAGAAEFNKAMTPARRDVAEAVLAMPFDPTRFEAALKRIYESEVAARTANIAASSAFVEHLTDRERAAFLKTLNWPGVPGSEKSAAEESATPKAP
jgi:uncharacterized membrane protein